MSLQLLSLRNSERLFRRPLERKNICQLLWGVKPLRSAVKLVNFPSTGGASSSRGQSYRRQPFNGRCRATVLEDRREKKKTNWGYILRVRWYFQLVLLYFSTRLPVRVSQSCCLQLLVELCGNGGNFYGRVVGGEKQCVLQSEGGRRRVVREECGRKKWLDDEGVSPPMNKPSLK